MFWVQIRPEVPLGMWISPEQVYRKEKGKGGIENTRKMKMILFPTYR